MRPCDGLQVDRYFVVLAGSQHLHFHDFCFVGQQLLRLHGMERNVGLAVHGGRHVLVGDGTLLRYPVQPCSRRSSVEARLQLRLEPVRARSSRDKRCVVPLFVVMELCWNQHDGLVDARSGLQCIGQHYLDPLRVRLRILRRRDARHDLGHLVRHQQQRMRLFFIQHDVRAGQRSDMRMEGNHVHDLLRRNRGSDLRRHSVGESGLPDGNALRSTTDHSLHLSQRKLLYSVSLESVHIRKRTYRLRGYLHGIRFCFSCQYSELRNYCTLHGGGDGGMELRQRIRWTCSTCGRKATVPSGTEVICPCSQGIPNPSFLHRTKLSKKRLIMCQGCKQYHDERCSLVDYGCRTTFRILLNNPESRCPAGNW